MTDAAKGTIFFWVTLLGGALFCVALIFPMLLPPQNSRPPFPEQRTRQRKTVQERVQAAGGWTSVRKECESLLKNSSRAFHWELPGHFVGVRDSTRRPSVSYETNIDDAPLPTGIAALNPHRLEGYALDSEPPIMRINLFGGRSTGTRGIPYYDIWIICGPAPDGFTPQLDFSPRVIKRIADAVFEVYQE